MKRILVATIVAGFIATAAAASVDRSFLTGDPAGDDSSTNLPAIDPMVRPGAVRPSDSPGFPDRRTARLRQQIGELTSALNSEQPDPEILYKRGMAYADLRDQDRAIVDFTEATKLDPNHFHAFNELARSYAAKGQLDRAIANFDRAIAIEPQFGAAYDYRGRIFARRGQFEKALADYDAALRINPDDERTLNDACWTRAVANRQLDKALENCDRAVSLRPINGNYLDSRAFVHFRLGNFADAVSDYDAALGRGLDSRAASLYMRGVAKLRLGDKTGGNIDIAGSRTLDPRIGAQFLALGVRP